MLRFVLCQGGRDDFDVALASRPDGMILDFTGATAWGSAVPWNGGPACLVRLVSPEDARFEAELESAMAWRPAGILARGTGGLADLERVSARIAVTEAVHGMADGAIGVTVLADDARSVRALRTLRPSSRLRGVAFDPGALASVLACRDDASAIALGAAEAVLAAASCGVPSLVVAQSEHWRERASIEGFSGVIETITPLFVRTAP